MYSTSVRVEILGPRMNRRAENGLEIPVLYRFLGQRKAVDWMAKKISVEEVKSAEQLETCWIRCNV